MSCLDFSCSTYALGLPLLERFVEPFSAYCWVLNVDGRGGLVEFRTAELLRLDVEVAVHIIQVLEERALCTLFAVVY